LEVQAEDVDVTAAENYLPQNRSTRTPIRQNNQSAEDVESSSAGVAVEAEVAENH
jgi:hypothetical protein